MKNALLLCFTMILSICICQAQQRDLSINGTIRNAEGIELEAATVFIAGSQKFTTTDKKGVFQFQNLTPGTYQVVINSIGYASIKKNLLLSDAVVVSDTVLQEQQIILDEVVIGDGSQRKNFMKTFLKYFMGESENAKACKIINPDKIEFATNKNVLKAYSNDFLIIENGMLGYRIKYLLRSFQYNSGSDATFYDGESIFENIEGTPEQKLT
jgi:ribosome-associated protein YbcJ (S4-like RNA binding protein)